LLKTTDKVTCISSGKRFFSRAVFKTNASIQNAALLVTDICIWLNNVHHMTGASRDSSVGMATGYGQDEFNCRQGLGIFLFTTASRTALAPTQSPIQWVQGAISLGVERSGCKADYSPPSSPEVKECVELYLPSPIRLRGVVLS
jgi:hypothetical protein